MPTKKPTKKPAKEVKKKAAPAKKEAKPVINIKYSTRGRVFEGTVISDKMAKTVTVEWPRQIFLPKFERFEKRKTRVKAHVPDGMEVKVDDFVKIAECRPISKTKNFIVVEVRKNNG